MVKFILALTRWQVNKCAYKFININLFDRLQHYLSHINQNDRLFWCRDYELEFLLYLC